MSGLASWLWGSSTPSAETEDKSQPRPKSGGAEHTPPTDSYEGSKTQASTSAAMPVRQSTPPPDAHQESLGITPKFKEFVKTISQHASSWTSFPVDAQAIKDFKLSRLQEEHAVEILNQVPQLQKIRYQICPRIIDEHHFWYVYFTVSAKYLPAKFENDHPQSSIRTLDALWDESAAAGHNSPHIPDLSLSAANPAILQLPGHPTTAHRPRSLSDNGNHVTPPPLSPVLAPHHFPSSSTSSSSATFSSSQQQPHPHPSSSSSSASSTPLSSSAASSSYSSSSSSSATSSSSTSPSLPPASAPQIPTSSMKAAKFLLKLLDKEEKSWSDYSKGYRAHMIPGSQLVLKPEERPSPGYLNNKKIDLVCTPNDVSATPYPLCFEASTLVSIATRHESQVLRRCLYTWRQTLNPETRKYFWLTVSTATHFHRHKYLSELASEHVLQTVSSAVAPSSSTPSASTTTPARHPDAPGHTHQSRATVQFSATSQVPDGRSDVRLSSFLDSPTSDDTSPKTTTSESEQGELPAANSSTSSSSSPPGQEWTSAVFDRLLNNTFVAMLDRSFGVHSLPHLTIVPSFGFELISTVLQRRFFLTNTGREVGKRLLALIGLQHPHIYWAPAVPLFVFTCLHFMDEAATYAILRRMVDQKPTRTGRRFLPLCKRDLAQELVMLDVLVGRFVPQWRHHFTHVVEEPTETLFYHWFETLFVDATPFPVWIRLMDHFVLDGFIVFHRFAVAALIVLQGELLLFDSLQGTHERLARYFEQLTLSTSESLFTITQTLSINTSIIENAFENATSYLTSLATRQAQGTFDQAIAAPAQPSTTPTLSVLHERPTTPIEETRHVEPFALDLSLREPIEFLRPYLHPPSAIVGTSQLEQIWSWLPSRYANTKPETLFSTQTDGYSLTTLMNRCSSYRRTILLIKTSLGRVFGAFFPTAWQKIATSRIFYGSADSFVFSFALGVPHVYRWALGNQDFFLASSEQHLCVGGDAIWLDGDLLRGFTRQSATFQSPPLDGADCEKSTFRCILLEVLHLRD